LIQTIFNDSIGKLLCDVGDIYEGEWKDGKKHGRGKKRGIYFHLLFVNTLIIQKVSNSIVMEIDMKESGKIIKSMEKVRQRDLL